MTYQEDTNLIWNDLWQFKHEPEDHMHPIMKLVEETGEYVGACVDARVKAGREHPSLRWLELCDITFYHRIISKQLEFLGIPLEKPVFLKSYYPDDWDEELYALALANIATNLAQFYTSTKYITHKTVDDYLNMIYTLCIKSAKFHYASGWDQMVTSNYDRLIASGGNGWVK